jgi:hypothetical protein
MHFIRYVLRDVPSVLSLVSSLLLAIYSPFCMPLIYLLTFTQNGINLHEVTRTCEYEVKQRTCLRYYLGYHPAVEGNIQDDSGGICNTLRNDSTVEPRFTNAPVHEQFGSRTNFPSKKRLGWRTVARVTNTQAGNSGKMRVSVRECQLLVNFGSVHIPACIRRALSWISLCFVLFFLIYY